MLYAGPLVGRDTEVARLTDFLSPIFAGRFAGLLTVYGEPGMGKSRLVHAVRETLEENHRVRWLTFPVEGILRQSLNPWRYGLREYFDLSDDVAEDANRVYFDAALDALIADLHERAAERLEAGARLGELARELDRTRSFFGRARRRSLGRLALQQVEARLENTFTACKALFLAESLRRPLVLVLEDGHWLDGDTEALLKTLPDPQRGGLPVWHPDHEPLS